jgi:hypothetical protein
MDRRVRSTGKRFSVWRGRRLMGALAVAGMLGGAAAALAGEGTAGSAAPEAAGAGATGTAAGAAGTAAGPGAYLQAPRDAAGASALFLEGPVTATWGPSGVRMTVGEISNQEAQVSLVSNPGLQLVATTTVPTVAQDGLIATAGNTPGFFVLGGAALPQVGPGSQIFQVDTGLVPYTPPPAGCYHVSVALDQFIDLLGLTYGDFRTLPAGTAGGEPDPGGSGFALFSFGGAACNAAANGSCTSSATTLCLERFAGDRRFQVQMSFRTQEGGGLAGDGLAMPLTPLGVGTGGLFFFFGASDPEMLVRVIDGCSLNARFWVFVAAATNVGFTVTVTDTVTGHSVAYQNPDLTPAQAVLDTSALACP